MQCNVNKQVVQREREEKLAETLKARLNRYVQGNKEDFINDAVLEVTRLSNAGNSSPLLISKKPTKLGRQELILCGKKYKLFLCLAFYFFSSTTCTFKATTN